MNSFETRIVKTWDPSWKVRIPLAVFLLGSGVIAYVWEPENPWLLNSAYAVYVICMFIALGQTFLKPRILGLLRITRDEIIIEKENESKIYKITELQDLGFDYVGYASFWKHTIYGNKNHLYFTHRSGEKRDLEITLSNKEMKEEFRSFLKELGEDNLLNVQQRGNFSF
ncbi:hypothetical protein [Christiangramia sp. OXR-203]|uniref:hypothetical protein n=1 Tax=Christiangramia sp. OXR-203 TaxID=3100176 RepID=UPI002AC8EA14|nr:hypothetical protein [Christiangramia sp. OXR-203]WPY98086.1 hypothetical protein T8I65_13000 [Christiangramia sp. OXR-203]